MRVYLQTSTTQFWVIMEQVSEMYIEGIKEGRRDLEKNGYEFMFENIANLKSTIKGFPASTPVGQMLRGELDFWKNQAKIKKLPPLKI